MCVIIPYPSGRARASDSISALQPRHEPTGEVAWDDLSSSDYELLERALSHGCVVVEADSSRELDTEHRRRVAALCERGLICRLLADPPSWQGRFIYVITEWGGIVWQRAKISSNRLELQRRV